MVEGAKFFWWEGETVAELVAQIEAKGGPAAVRVEFHLTDRLLYVRAKDAAAVTASSTTDDGINFSHICPPECPE